MLPFRVPYSPVRRLVIFGKCSPSIQQAHFSKGRPIKMESFGFPSATMIRPQCSDVGMGDILKKEVIYHDYCLGI
jgi:hypothetical protein